MPNLMNKWTRKFIHLNHPIIPGIQVVWVIIPCSDVVGHQYFGGPCCLHLQGDGGSMVLQNVGILPHVYTVSQPRRPWLESSSLWKPQIPHYSKYLSFRNSWKALSLKLCTLICSTLFSPHKWKVTIHKEA